MKGSLLLTVTVGLVLVMVLSPVESLQPSALTLKNHGQYCKSGAECDKEKYLVCDSDTRYGLKKCVCRDDMVYINKDRNGRISNGKCVHKVGGVCRIVIRAWPDDNFPCTPNAYCDTKTNKCTCQAGFNETFDGHCGAKLEVNSPCSSDLQCGKDNVTGSQLVCHNGKCSCEPSESVYATVERHVYHHSDRNVSSLCAPLPTKNCYKGFCAPGAKCSAWYHLYYKQYHDGYYWDKSAKCYCTYPFELNPTTLRCTSPYNGTCSSSIPCTDGLICSDGRCGCMPRQHFNPHQKKCFSRAGGFCNGTVGCVPNAECDPSNGVCACNSGFVRDSEDSCVGEFGAPCNELQPCDQSRNDLVCNQGTCKCKPGLQNSLNIGRCSLGYNSSCLGIHPCGDNMKCGQQGLCDCRDGMHHDKLVDKCLISAREHCGSENKCGTNADCKDDFCRCNDGYTGTPSGACVADFGTSCLSDSDCAQTTNSLVCVNETCACKPKHQMSPATGLCSLEHGAPCNLSIPCFDKLVCNGVCSCPETHFSLDKRCLSYAGDSCSEATDCIPNANCYYDDTCTCSKGYVQNTAGLCDPDFGSPCSSSGDCAKNENNLICENGTCACPSGLKMSDSTKSCYLQFNDSCNSSIPCAAGLVCNCRCSCPTGQYFDSNRCISYAQNVCTESANCVPNAGCFNETCVCSEGYVQSPFGECKADIGIYCSSSADCDRFKNQLICTENHICVCPHGSPTDGVCSLESQTLKNSTCDVNRTGRDLKLNETCPPCLNYGDPCNDTCSTCLISDFLECQNGTCVCNANFHFDAEQETCSHVDGHGLLGNACIDGSFCTAGECVDGICECPLKFYRNGSNSCSLKKSIHKPCSLNSECGNDEFTASDLLCLNGTCSCNPKSSVWSTAFQNDCRSVYSLPKLFCAPLPNQPCVQGFCSLGAICRMHFFGYGKNSFYINTSSVQENNYTISICDCIPPFQVSPQSGLCSSPLGHLCNSAVPCMDNLECNDGTCTCTSTQHLDPDANICRSLVSQSCSQDSECTFFSHCANGICSCQTGYKPTEIGLCAAEVGGFCSVDADCDQVNNKLNCYEGSCQCKTGLKLNPTTGICSLPHNAKCTPETHCGDTLDCINGQCACDSGFYDETRDRCLSKVDSPCNRDSDCVKWSFCFLGFCHCDDKADETGQRFCALKHRATCNTTDECNSDAGLVCKNFKCECPWQHVYSVKHGLCQGLSLAACLPIRSAGLHGRHAPSPCVDEYECAMKPPSKSFKCVPKSKMLPKFTWD